MCLRTQTCLGSHPKVSVRFRFLFRIGITKYLSKQWGGGDDKAEMDLLGTVATV